MFKFQNFKKYSEIRGATSISDAFIWQRVKQAILYWRGDGPLKKLFDYLVPFLAIFFRVGHASFTMFQEISVKRLVSTSAGGLDKSEI